MVANIVFCVIGLLVGLAVMFFIQKSILKSKAETILKEAKAEAEPVMASLFASSLSDSLLALDVMTMTPLEAMNELYRLQEQAKKEAGRA